MQVKVQAAFHLDWEWATKSQKPMMTDLDNVCRGHTRRHLQLAAPAEASYSQWSSRDLGTVHRERVHDVLQGAALACRRTACCVLTSYTQGEMSMLCSRHGLLSMLGW
jgi:hypothetical protein